MLPGFISHNNRKDDKSFESSISIPRQFDCFFVLQNEKSENRIRLLKSAASRSKNSEKSKADLILPSSTSIKNSSKQRKTSVPVARQTDRLNGQTSSQCHIHRRMFTFSAQFVYKPLGNHPKICNLNSKDTTCQPLS